MNLPFHKSSHTCMKIYYSFKYTIQHKLAAYKSKIHRLTNIPLLINYLNKEFLSLNILFILMDMMLLL